MRQLSDPHRGPAGLPSRDSASPARGLTVIVPAYNEAADIADTIRSIQAQTTPPAEILVVDDFSDDGTGDAARFFSTHTYLLATMFGSALSLAAVLVAVRVTALLVRRRDLPTPTPIAPDAPRAHVAPAA